MLSKGLAYAVVAALLGDAQAAPTPQGGCQDMTFSITATAENLKMPRLPDLSEPGAVLSYFISLPDLVAKAKAKTITRTYDIFATYCAPPGDILDQVQLLVHGGTYTRQYWMGGAWNGSDVYSWTKYANDNGFATLAVDQLGNGLSSHPDPLEEVQLTMEVEILNTLAQKIKTGEITGNPSKVVYVGHALGSITGTMLAAKYPASIDKLVLTGYTSNPSNISAGVVAGQYSPAAIVDPVRFGPLPQGYVTQSTEPARAVPFYRGNFDPENPPLDWDTKGTIAVGETLNLATVPVPGYRGGVFVLTGDMDSLFCGTDPNASCEPIIQATASEFPDASNFAYFMPKNTGVVLNFHRSAHQSFGAVTNWILNH